MWPASPQSITRCAMLMPAPAMIGLFVQVADFIDRAAVNAHPDVKFGMTLQLLTDFHRA